MLADHQFSDLLLFPHSQYKFKGCPGTEQKLIPVPDDCLEEVGEILAELPQEFMLKQVNPLPSNSVFVPPGEETISDDPGNAARSRSIRYHHNGVWYRVAATKDVLGELAFFLRRLPATVPDLSVLGLPSYLTDWLLEPESLKGLVLITGAQAVGKSTTAAALTAGRLKKWGGHALTLECPAELPLGGKWGDYGFCVQTEISSEHELARQIECAHRFSSPNVILIGEIRTQYAALEVLRIAQGSSHQVVISTAFGLDMLTALNSLLKGVKEIEGESAGHHLANCLLCVIHQDIQTVEGKRTLRIPQFMMVPFSEEGQSIRSKIRDGRIIQLQDDIREQRNRIIFPSMHK